MNQPTNALDLDGDRFGRVVRRDRSRSGKSYWLCACDCGTTKVVAGQSLVRAKARSCGCLRRELQSARMTTHGKSGSPEYRAYENAKTRCTNANVRSFADYGAKGVEFRFASFAEWYLELGPRPGAHFSVDRVDTTGHYESGNVRWATAIEQASNKRCPCEFCPGHSP
jgi:hypothetical protein